MKYFFRTKTLAQFEEFQNKLFKLGYGWGRVREKCRHLSAWGIYKNTALFIDNSSSLMYGDADNPMDYTEMNINRMREFPLGPSNEFQIEAFGGYYVITNGEEFLHNGGNREKKPFNSKGVGTGIYLEYDDARRVYRCHVKFCIQDVGMGEKFRIPGEQSIYMKISPLGYKYAYQNESNSLRVSRDDNIEVSRV